MYENPPYYITAYGLAVKRGFTGTEEGISSQAICALSSFYEGSFTVADSAAGCAGCGGCGRNVQ